jgi:large subunit ribosomal protein L30
MATKKKAAGLKIKLVKSLICCKDDQIATAHSLGLRKIGDETVQPENASTMGKIKKITHLVEVTQA